MVCIVGRPNSPASAMHRLKPVTANVTRIWSTCTFWKKMIATENSETTEM